MKFALTLITGATSGLGYTLAKLLAKDSRGLILTGRNIAALQELQDELNKDCSTQILQADLSLATERQKLLAEIRNKKPDLVINCAGLGLYGDVLSYSLEDQLELLETNAKAVIEITIESARTMIRSEKQGTIVNISSLAGEFIYPSFAMYSSSKAFVSHFSRSFDREVAPYGVRVLTTVPGQIKTSFRQKASSDFDTSSSGYSMSAEKASLLILKQIEDKKPYQIIDGVYLFFYYIAKFLIPPFLLNKIITRSIRSRIPSRNIVL